MQGQALKVTFNLKNTGARPGAEIAQVYVSLPASAGEPPKRLVAWDKVQLAAGQVKKVTLTLDPQYLSIFNADKGGWELVAGNYKVWVGSSSRNLPLSETVKIGD
jgi:beta-glucosidase